MDQNHNQEGDLQKCQCVDHNCIRQMPEEKETFSGPDPEILKEGVHLVAVIYSITNFYFF